MARPKGTKKYSPEQLQEKIDEYFEVEKEPTMGGLAIHLDMSRSSLLNYRDDDNYLNIVKKAHDRVEAIYEKRLIYKPNPTGVIFALKNMGWKDSQQIEHKADIVWNETLTYDPNEKAD